MMGLLSRVGRAAVNELRGGTPEAMERARKMGFDVDTPLYHGTYADFEAFDSAQPQRHRLIGDNAIYMSESPEVAGSIIRHGKSGANIKPLFVRGPLATAEQWDAALRANRYDGNAAVAALEAQGFTGVRGKLFYNDGEVAIFDPKNIRSRFAAFDPAKSDSANLLAAVPAAVGAGGLLSRIGVERDQ